MKKFLYFAVPIFLVLAVATAIYFYYASKKQQTSSPPTNGQAVPFDTGQNKSSLPVTNQKNEITIKSKSGNITVKNFEKNAEATSNGLFYFADNKSYNIAFNPTTNEFIVTLLINQEIEKTRKEAENELISALGISQQDACKLKVFLYVSAAINDKLSTNHNLSFCPENISFPN
jgi:hypothetical protein